MKTTESVGMALVQWPEDSLPTGERWAPSTFAVNCGVMVSGMRLINLQYERGPRADVGGGVLSPSVWHLSTGGPFLTQEGVNRSLSIIPATYFYLSVISLRG